MPRLPLQHRCAWATLPGSVGDPPYARGTSSSTHEASGCRWASSVWSIHSPQRWQSGWVARTWARMACRRLVLRLSTSGVHRGCGGVRLVRRGVGTPSGRGCARGSRPWSPPGRRTTRGRGLRVAVDWRLALKPALPIVRCRSSAWSRRCQGPSVHDARRVRFRLARAWALASAMSPGVMRFIPATHARQIASCAMTPWFSPKA